MFNLNESNRIVMVQHPGHLRIGANGMCGKEAQLLLTSLRECARASKESDKRIRGVALFVFRLCGEYQQNCTPMSHRTKEDKQMPEAMVETAVVVGEEIGA